MHIVYSVCGETIKAEFLTSLKSLYLLAISGFVRGPAYYHIHVLSDGAVAKEDLSFLRPLSNFKASVHPTFPNATMLFKTCSTERIYLHQHKDFQDLDKVTHPLTYHVLPRSLAWKKFCCIWSGEVHMTGWCQHQNVCRYYLAGKILVFLSGLWQRLQMLGSPIEPLHLCWLEDVCW